MHAKLKTCLYLLRIFWEYVFLFRSIYLNINPICFCSTLGPGMDDIIPASKLLQSMSIDVDPILQHYRILVATPLCKNEWWNEWPRMTVSRDWLPVKSSSITLPTVGWLKRGASITHPKEAIEQLTSAPPEALSLTIQLLQDHKQQQLTTNIIAKTFSSSAHQIHRLPNNPTKEDRTYLVKTATILSLTLHPSICRTSSRRLTLSSFSWRADLPTIEYMSWFQFTCQYSCTCLSIWRTFQPVSFEGQQGRAFNIRVCCNLAFSW